MKFMRRTAGYSSLDHKGNDILEEIKVDNAGKKLLQYEQKRFNHVSRMEDIICPQRHDDRHTGRP
jgi:hypothetical protein